MNGYRVTLWQPVYHNGEYKHTIERYVTIEADSPAEACKLTPLLKADTTIVDDKLTISVGEEYVKDAKDLGRAKWVLVRKYEKEE
jgi:hypothetical protein